jgi:uncharacterized protein YraI
MTMANRGLLLAVTFGGMIIAGPAFAVTVYSTAHLNLRTGPGEQYPVIGVLEHNVAAEADGCLKDWSWCSITVGGINGWAAAQYLVVDDKNHMENVATARSKTRIAEVEPEGVDVVVAPPAIGAVIGVEGGAVFEAITPAPEVLAYIAQPTVGAVNLNGEIVVGATLPAEVILAEVPSSPYQYAVVNGLTVLVDPGTRQVVYIYR